MSEPLPGEIRHMRISVIGPVLNEVEWIGYSMMAALPWVHEFIYALDENSSDGTRDLLFHMKHKRLHEKLVILETPNFHPSDQKAYNAAFNDCLDVISGQAAWFLHPDMIVTKGTMLEEGPLAWTVNMTSYARDFKTVISKGRCSQWKNIHANKFGLRYLGGYGSSNEDFYHTEITGNTLKHYGTDFGKYPFEVMPSGIEVSHFCELKPYSRRLEKMKLCLKQQHPGWYPLKIEETAMNHPRVTLEPSPYFPGYEFSETDSLPSIFTKYPEFEMYKEGLWPYQKPQLSQPRPTELISTSR